MPEEQASFLAACVQLRSGVDRATNVEMATRLIEEAAGKGASFVATPEMTNLLDLDSKRLFANLEPEDTLEEIQAFSELAASLNIWLLIGSMAVKIGEKQAANRSFFYAPNGSVITKYDKIHMFDVALPNGESWKESAVYAPGEKATVIKTPMGTVGLSVCYDLRFPPLYRKMAQSGANIFCAPAAFTRITGKCHWEILLRSRAIENGAFMIAPAQGGVHEDGRETWGHSMIVGPWGEILAAAENDAPGVILAEIDLQNVHKARQSIPNLALEMPYEIINVAE